MTDHPGASPANEGDREWGEHTREDRTLGNRTREGRTWIERDRDALPSAARREPVRPSGDGVSETGTDDAKATLREQIRELEAELERSEHRVQRVIDHYERLLTEKNRKLGTDPEETADESLSSLTAVLWWRAD
jgi:hypothetical protein